MKNISLLIGIFLYQIAVGQTDFKNYVNIKQQNPVPSDVLHKIDEYMDEEKEKIEHSDVKKRKDQKVIKEVKVSSSYALNRLFGSGKILFNDPLTNYVNKVADNLLAHNPTLRSKVKFYVAKSSVVNAFSYMDGTIIVNLGLIAQCTNEAQLAFLLAHEVVHVKNSHTIKEVIEEIKASKSKEDYDDYSKSEKLIMKSVYNKDQEKEADFEGFEIYKKSPYATENIDNFFDVLRYDYLPIDEVPFDFSFFEFEHFKLPIKFKAEKLNPIGPMAAKYDEAAYEDDATHPSTTIRKTIITREVQKNNNNGKTYIQSKDKFEEIRDIARFEVSYLLYLNHQFSASIYNSYVMLKKYPNNLYLTKLVAMSLEKIGETKYTGQLGEFSPKLSEIEGESYRLFYLMDKMEENPNWLYTTATAYVAEMLLKYPEDKDFKRILRNLIHLQRREMKYEISSFKIEEYKSELSKLKTDIEVLKKDSTKYDKYDKIKMNDLTSRKDTIIEEDNWQYAYINYINDKYFKLCFNEKLRISTSFNDLNKKNIRMMLSGGGVKEDIAVVSPEYFNTKRKKRTNELQIDKTLKNRSSVINICNSMAKSSNITTTNVNKFQIGESDADRFDDIYWLETAMYNRLAQENVKAGNCLMESKYSALKTKYNSSHFYFSGVRELNYSKNGYIFYTIFFPPLLLASLPSFALSGHHMTFYSLLINIENGGVEYVDSRKVNSNNKGVLESFYFNNFYTIKRDPAKKKGKETFNPELETDIIPTEYDEKKE
jgi:beta-barrel assembly-enhancing protease